MSEFNETVRFPDDISYGVEFGPEFFNSVSRNEAGREYRTRISDRSLCSGDCSHNIKTREELDEVLKFFRAMAGRWVGFRFKDWTDYTLDGQGNLELITTTTFQIQKLYAVGSFTEVRNIRKPIEDTLVISDESVVLAEGSDYTVDYATGVVTFDTPPVAPEIEEGEFDVPVRFGVDRVTVTVDTFSTFSVSSIPIQEIPDNG